MAEFPALPLWTDAYLGDTTHLTTIEHGAYLLLLMTAWRTSECALPDDDRLLARYARLDARQWKRMKPILAEFFVISDGKWRQRRLDDEREAVMTHKQKMSERGQAGAAAKALKTKGRHQAQARTSKPSAEAQDKRETSSHSHIEKDKDKSLSKKTLPDDWKPEPFGEGSQSRRIVDRWTQDALDHQIERFRAHHRGAGSKFADWQSAWSTWVLNSERFATERRQHSPQKRDELDVIYDDLVAQGKIEAAGRE